MSQDLPRRSGPSAPTPPTETPPPRRRLLGWLAGATALGATPWLAACGGGGGDSPGADAGGGGGGGDGGNGGGGAGGLSDLQRLFALTTVGTRWRELVASAGTPASRAEAMAAHMTTVQAYAESGFDADSGCAWGRFLDGRAHLVCFTSPLPPEGLAARGNAAPSFTGTPPSERAQALRAQLPQQHLALATHSFGEGFNDGDAIVDAISGWLGARQYVMQNGAVGDASLVRLRQLRDLGYFYINTHGGNWGNVERSYDPVAGVQLPNFSPKLFAISSSSVYSAALERTPEVVDDLNHWRLVYFTAANGLEGPDGKPLCSEYYGITRHFVERYWRFAPNAVVVINACSSARTDAQWAAGFVVAVHQAGAAVYTGWTDTVSIVGADRAPRYFTDRLLGSNGQAPKVNPPQRAFPYDQVLAEMKAQGLDLDPQKGARFVAVRNPVAADVQILAPAIHHCDVLEAGDGLVLHGDFGSVPGRVEVAQQALTVLAWEKHRVYCRLPRSGPGSSGPVQVFVGAVFSNQRHITHWQLPIALEFTDDARPGLKVQGQGHIGLRADIGPRRDAPGETPKRPLVFAQAMIDSAITCTASGSYGTPCASQWSGSETYVTAYAADPFSQPNPPLVSWFRIDTATGRAALSLAFGLRGAGQLPYLESGCDTARRFTRPIPFLDAEVLFANPGLEHVTFEFEALHLTMDANRALQRRTFFGEEVAIVLSQAPATHPPMASDEI